MCELFLAPPRTQKTTPVWRFNKLGYASAWHSQNGIKYVSCAFAWLNYYMNTKVWFNFITLTDRVFFVFFWNVVLWEKSKAQTDHKPFLLRFTFVYIKVLLLSMVSLMRASDFLRRRRRKIQKQNMPTTNDNTGLGMNLPFCWQGFTLNISFFWGGGWKADDDYEYGDIHHFIAKPWSIEAPWKN